jgi:hypothetical protein
METYLLEIALLLTLQWVTIGVVTLAHIYWKAWHVPYGDGSKFMDAPWYERYLSYGLVIGMGPAGYIWIRIKGA